MNTDANKETKSNEASTSKSNDDTMITDKSNATSPDTVKNVSALSKNYQSTHINPNTDPYQQDDKFKVIKSSEKQDSVDGLTVGLSQNEQPKSTENEHSLPNTGENDDLSTPAKTGLIASIIGAISLAFGLRRKQSKENN